MPHPTSLIGKYLRNHNRNRLEYMFFDALGEMRTVYQHSRVTHVVTEGEPVVCAVLFENGRGGLVTDQLVLVEELRGIAWDGLARAEYLTAAENRLLSAQRLVKLQLLITE